MASNTISSNNRLKRLFSEFELDLIRLLRTVSLISQCKDILLKNVEHLDLKSIDFQKTLGEFTIRLFELEKEISGRFIANSEQSLAHSEELKKYIDDLNILVDETIKNTRKLKDSLESKSRADIKDLESIERLYDLELKATQKELESRLSRLEGCILENVKAIRESDKNEIEPPSEIDSRTRYKADAADESRTFAKQDSPAKLKTTMFSLFSLVIGFVIGITVFYFLISNEFPLKAIPKKTQDISSEILTEKTDSDAQEAEGKVAIYHEPPEGTNSEQKKKSYIERKKTKPIGKKILLKVDDPAANLRKGPGINYTVISTAEAGDKLEYLNEQRGIWMKIKTKDEEEGWISEKLVREVDQ